MDSIKKTDVLQKLPPEWPQDLMPEIEAQVRQAGAKIVVLDDDPTGNQTVHDVAVLTEWCIPSLRAVFAEPSPVVYILTNSRSVPLTRAQEINQQIATNLKAASLLSGRDFTIISRSDSTLRGHYPGEIDALTATLGDSFDGVLLIPFFIEGGRLTIDNTHYVTSGEDLIPAGDTEYAHDPVFGYYSSDLQVWVTEKNPKIKAEEVDSISIYDIRLGGPDVVTGKLNALSNGQVCVVNAASYRDLEVFVMGLLQAERTGKRFIYRTAASFVRVRGGILPQPLLHSKQMNLIPGCGLIIAGSYVEKTTQQLRALNALPRLQSITLAVPSVLDVRLRECEIQRVIDQANATLQKGQDALIFTSRDRISMQAGKTSLGIGQMVSNALVSIVQGLSHRPAWIIAKGGITASDIATRGLGVRKGYVLGQVLPGIPVWQTGEESRWPGLTYVVFPGNVGDANALLNIVHTLRG